MNLYSNNEFINSNNLFVNLSPLDQFEIKNFISINSNLLSSNFSLTNIGLYLIISGFLIIGLHLLAINYNRIISNY